MRLSRDALASLAAWIGADVKEPKLTRLTTNLTLAPDAAIDLHMHTNFSDGRWPAQQLIDFLVTEGYALVSVTDHDRVDTVAGIQELAAQQNLPVLAGVEMSTEWHGKMGHVLCYGFDAQQNSLHEITEMVVKRQLENTHQVNEELRRKGYQFPRQEEVLAENGGKYADLPTTGVCYANMAKPPNGRLP